MRLLPLLLPLACHVLIRVPQDVDSLQTAIDLAMVGDTVLLAPGTWTERVNIPSGNLCLNLS